MAKRGFNIGKFITAAQKEILFERSGDTVYLADRKGGVAIQTDADVLAELEKRGAVLTENPDLKAAVERMMQTQDANNSFTYIDTEIHFPYWDSTTGKKKTLVMFRDYQQEFSVKLTDTKYADIFDPALIVGGKSYSHPLIMICEGCYGFVLPIRPKRFYLQDQMENIKALSEYMEDLR